MEHAITFAFGTELHPNNVLCFTICMGEDEYITLIATTLYVTRILCSTLPQSTDTSSAPSASSTCSIFSLDAKSLSAVLTPRRSLQTTEMRLSPSTMSYAADQRGLTTALADLITAPTSTRTMHSGMRRTQARRRRSMRAMRSMPRLRPMRPCSSVFLVLCPTCHFDSMIYAHLHNILCLKPQRPVLYVLHTQHVIVCPPPARPTCRVCKLPCLSNICSADAATAVICLDVCLPCQPRWQSASSVLRLSPPTTSAVVPCPTQPHSQLFCPSTPFLASAAMSASSGALLPSAPALLSEPPTTSAASNKDQSQSPILSKSQWNKLRKRAKAAQAAATKAKAAVKSTGGRDYNWHHTHMAKLFERTTNYAAHQKKGSKGDAENFAINTQLTELLGIATGYNRVLLGKNIPHPTNPLKMVLNDRVPVPF
jgi:hypothetical protein